jgi:hypothetical protein
MNHKRNLQLIGVFVSLILSMTVLTGCDFFDRNNKYPVKIEFPAEGGTVTSSLNYILFNVVPDESNTDDTFNIYDYDTVYGSDWLKVEVSSSAKTTRFMVEPNTTGRKRRIRLNHFGPDNTDVDIIQNP